MEQEVVEIGKGSFWYFWSTLVYAVLGFVALPILSRLFTTKQYGIYSLCTVTIGFSMVLTSWLVQSIVRYCRVHEGEGSLDVFVTTVMRFMLYFAGILVCIVAPLSVILASDNNTRLLVALVVLISAGTSFALIQNTFLRVRRKAKLYSVFYLSEASGRFLVGVALVGLFHLGPAAILAGWLATLVVILPLQARALRIWHNYKRGDYSWSLIGEFLRYGVPLSGTVVMVMILSLSDRYLVQAFRGPAEVGLYAIVYTMLEAIFDVIFAALPLSAEPVIVEAYERQGEQRVRQIIRLLSRYAMMVILPVAAALVFLQSRVMHIVVGPQFFSAEKVILPLVIGFTFERMVWFAGWGYILKKRTIGLLMVISIAAIANIVLNLFLIPAWGYLGAAISTAITYILSFSIIAASGRKYLIWDFPWVSLRRIAASTAILSVVLFFLNRVLFSGFLGLVIIVIAGASVYLVLLLVSKELKWSELKTIYAYGLRKMSSLVPWLDND